MIRWNRLSLVTIFLLAATTAPVGAAAQTVDYVVRGTVVASLSNGTVNIPTSTPFLSLLGSSFEIQAEVDPTVTREFALGFNPEGPNTFHYGGSFSFAVGGFSGVGADHTQLIGLQNDMPRSSVTRLDSFTLSANQFDLSQYTNNDAFGTFQVGALNFGFIDFTGSALDSKELPTSLNSQDFDAVFMRLRLNPQSGPGMDIVAQVDSITISSVPTMACVGFMAPFDRPISLNKRTMRAIPVAIELLDEHGGTIIDVDIPAPPVVNVGFSGMVYGTVPPDDAELLPLGQANTDNRFRFDPESGRWVYHLGTRLFQAAGTYTVTVASGDPSAYAIGAEGGVCSQTFDRLP